MKCPNCGKELHIPDNTLINMQAYVQNVMSVTECCGTFVSCFPKVVFNVATYGGDVKVDNWGRPATGKAKK